MELLISILALLISIYALIVASGMRRRVRKLDGESLYRSSQIKGVEEDLEQRITVLGRFVALASQGRRLTEEQVLEDRLFDDIDAGSAQELIARNKALAVDVAGAARVRLRSHTCCQAGAGQSARRALAGDPA